MTKTYADDCAGTSLLFSFDTNNSRVQLIETQKRLKFESLNLLLSDILLLENQNINGNHYGTSVCLLAAFSANTGKSWEIGAVLFQTNCEVAIIKVTISRDVSKLHEYCNQKLIKKSIFIVYNYLMLFDCN